MADYYNISNDLFQERLEDIISKSRIIWNERFKYLTNPYADLYGGQAEMTDSLILEIYQRGMLGPVRHKLVGEKHADQSYDYKYTEHLEIYYKQKEHNIYEFVQLSKYPAFMNAEIQDLMTMAGKWEQVEFVRLVLNAFVNPCIDGYPFFNHTHPVPTEAGNLNIDNLIDVPLSKKGLETAITRWNSWRGYSGEYLSDAPTHLVVAGNLEFQAWEILNTEKDPGTSKNDKNYFFNRYNLIIMRELPNDYWMLLNCNGPYYPFKPVIFSTPEMPGIVFTQDTDIRHILTDMTYRFGIDGATGGYYGLPETALASTGGHGSSS